MADETIQIKQEPLEQNYTAEMGDVDVDTASGSRGNIEGSSDIRDKSASNQNKILDIVDLNPNIIIKEEPDVYKDNYAETVFASVDAVDINPSNILKNTPRIQEDVQVKVEPEDNFDYATENFKSSKNVPQYSNDTSAGQKQLPNLSCHFQVLDEHENIITVTAADRLSPNNEELAFIEKLKQNLKTIEAKKSKKTVVCKLCMKRCTQGMYYAYHMEQHRRNRIFCVRKTCERWFSSLEECEAHEYNLHDLKIYKCNVCNHKFQNFEQLCQHKLKMHSKLQRFICSICRDWFISKQELHEHWASLFDRCGRIAHIQEETPEQIFRLLQKPKPTIESRNSYKIKKASTAIPAGLKLKMKPILDNSTSQENTNIPPNRIEIKHEQMDYDTVIPDFPLKQITESLNTNEVQIHSDPAIINGLPIAPTKLRLRKLPLSSTTVENENDTSVNTSAILENKRNSLGQALAHRITAKFSLKSVPKMFNVINKIREDILENPPWSTPDSLQKTPNVTKETKTNIVESGANTTQTKANINEMPTKILKLSTNFKIVKMSKEFQPNLVNVRTTNTSTQASNNNRHSATTDTPSALSTSGVQQNILLNSSPDNSGRSFILKEIEVQPLDKTAVVAKLESITKANKELSLSELLNEVTVHKSNESTTNVEVNQMVEINAEDIKKELENEMFEQQNDDNLSAETFSDCSLGSGSNSTTTNAIFQNGGDLPKRQKSPRSIRRNNRCKRKDYTEGYVCPKCSRRYSSQTMVKEHLRNNCGRNPRNECDICHKCFFSISTLNCHRTIHTGELPHKCNYCEKRFRTRGQVTVHHRTHTGERPFVCEICSQSFTHRETLISHLSRHIGMKRYKCYGCNKQFSCISGLSMHRSTRSDTCGKFELNTRAIGPRVRVIRGRVVFEPQPTEPEDVVVDQNNDDASICVPLNEVLTEIQNK